MEKQSTSKFLRSVIAVVALFMLVVSGVLLASCKEEHVHTEPNNYGACTDCGSIIDWDKFGSQMSTLLDPSFDDLTASLTVLASEVTEVKGDVDSIIDALNVAGDGSDIDTIVQNVQAVLDQITALIGAENVAARSTPATITGIASAITGVQQTLNKIGAGNIEHVCDQHVFDTNTPIVEIAPSCERAGAKVYRCSNCNATIALPVNQLEHVADDEPVKENEKPATCTEAGSYDLVYYCKNGCNEVLSRETVTVDPEGHDYQVTSSTATCTEAGTVTYTCSKCSDSYDEPGTILPHTYDWTAAPVSEVAPKCEVEGSATYKCANCDTTVTLTPSSEKPEDMTEDQWTAFVEKYSALEHSYDSQEWVYTDKIKYNVLLESGTIVDQIERALYDVCSLCKAVKPALKDGQPITEITNHKLVVEDRTFENTNIEWYADLTEDELVDYGFVAAEEGGEAINADKISKSGYVNISCSQEATLYFVCVDTNCDIKHTEEADNAIQIVLPALDHVWVDGEITTPATCTEPGVMSTKCSICETAGAPKDIPATDHNWVKDEERSKPATCEVNGVIYYVCANDGCDAEYSEEIIASHDWVTIPGTERVQWIGGNLDYHNRIWMEKCSICGEEREQTEAEDHAKRYYNAEEVAQDDELSQELFEFYGVRVVEHAKYGFVFTTAACDDPGPVVNVCECGHIELVPNTSVSPQDHTWEETEIAPEDPCLGVTIKHKECKWCDAEVEVPLGDPAGHTWVVEEQVDPTCDTNGWEGFAYCEECGKVIMFEASAEETEPDKMSIDYVEGVICDGTDASIEAVKDLEGISIGALGHEWSEAPKQFCTDGCLNPVWEVTYCERCFNYDNEGDFTIKLNGPEYPAGDEGYVDTDLGAASDEFIVKLLQVLNWAGSTDIPPVSFTKEDLTSDAFNGHYNITGIKYVAAKGHTLTEYQSAYDVDATTWSYSETKAAVCVVDKNLDSYADALAFAKVVAQAALGTKYDETEFETDFAAAFDEIFDTTDENRSTYVIPTDGTKPALAGVCSKCGLPIAVTEHEEVYNMYVVTNGVNGAAYVPGEEIDYNTAHVHADDPNTTTVDEARYYVVDKDGVLRVNPDGTPIGMSNAEIAAQSVYSKAVYTYEEVKEWGFTNDNGSVNCYFYSFCVNCGKAMGTTNNHTFPTSDNWNKYHNCMQGDICFWCDKVISTVMGHNMQDLEEIAASENERYAAAAAELYAEAEADPDTYDWVGKDTVEDIPCHDEDGNVQYAEKWDIQVCVSCLVAWAEENLNFKGWTEIDEEDPDNDGNFSSIFEKQEGKHNFKPVDQDGNLVTGEEELDSSAHNCLTGYGVRYICQDPNCNYVLTYEDQQSGKFDYTKDFEELNEDNYIDETYKESVPHTVAPVVNYTEAGNNYIAPTTDHAAYMNFICIKCGETLQGNYDEGNLDENGTALDYYRYYMATDEEIADYTEAGSVYGEVEAAAESDRAPLPEATEPVVPPVGGGDETEQGGEGGAGAGAGAGADAGAGDGTV